MQKFVDIGRLPSLGVFLFDDSGRSYLSISRLEYRFGLIPRTVRFAEKRKEMMKMRKMKKENDEK
jgi:hypothetical protein